MARTPRVATCILLLYGPRWTRVRSLTLDDVTRNEHGEVALRLGEPSSAVPESFAALLPLVNQCTDANSDRWLFTGRHADQPVHFQGLLRQIRKLGLAPRTARAAALRELVLQVPVSVVADALELRYTTTQRQNKHVGGVWNRYAAARSARS